MKLKYLASVILACSTLAGCGTPAIIKKVEDRPIQDLKASETTKPIQFTKIVLKLKRGEHIGAWKAGILCTPNGDLNWKGGKINIDSEEFTDTFKEELEKYSFKAVGDSNALFEDASTWKSEILVAGLVKELKANICYPMAGYGNFNSSKGEAYLKVDWQIYSKLDRSVVHSVTTEGAAKSTDSVGGGDSIVVLNAFSQATRNLLADEKFRQIISRGGEAVKETNFKSGESIILSNDPLKGLGKSADTWSQGVVTVFAGNGHGSGFVLSDDLIMTNHHVVGESNNVTVKFNNGMQVVGKVVASNSGRDVAVVKVSAKLPKYFKLAKVRPAVGSDVYALGSPLDEKLHSSITRGIVSGFRDENNKTLIQSDVNIRPGNSGGPLIDKNGQVVGIAVSGLVINNVSQGINFFIPIDDALKSLGVI